MFILYDNNTLAFVKHQPLFLQSFHCIIKKPCYNEGMPDNRCFPRFIRSDKMYFIYDNLHIYTIFKCLVPMHFIWQDKVHFFLIFDLLCRLAYSFDKSYANLLLERVSEWI